MALAGEILQGKLDAMAQLVLGAQPRREAVVPVRYQARAPGNGPIAMRNAVAAAGVIGAGAGDGGLGRG